MTALNERARAYVDGELDAEEASRFEQLLADDPVLAADVAALKASRLPYQAALDTRPRPPLPSNVRAAVSDAVAAARDEQAHQSAEARPRHSRTFARLATAAAFVLGLILGPVFVGQFERNGTPAEQAQSDAAWAALVASYQSLYVPETLGDIDRERSREDAARLLASLAADTGLPARIPDLGDAGYAFVRAQQLGYRGEPLVQLVYAGEDGKPLALCFMRADADGVRSEQVVADVFAELGTIRWRERDLRFVIVADEDTRTLSALRELSLGSAG